jgi:hypothetical protein
MPEWSEILSGAVVVLAIVLLLIFNKGGGC